MLYTKNGSYPKPIPFRIVLSDGTTRTDPTTFTEEEITDAGYVLVDNPPVITENQILSWDGVSWQVRDKTEGELFDEYISIVPRVVSMRQARLALLSQGLLDTVNAALTAMEGDDGVAARIEWEYATEVDRNSPLVQSLVQALGLTDQQLYDLFLLAETL